MRSFSEIIKPILKAIGAIIFDLSFVFIISMIFAWPVQILWNWLMPVIFELTKITFWQSWGILLLSELIIKGSSSSGSSKKYQRKANY